MLSIEKWILSFLEGYRFEGLKLGPKDKQYLAPYIREQLLAPRCEVETVILHDPFCLLFLFFFGPHVHDRRVSVHNSGWRRIHSLMDKFSTKHSALHINYEKLETMISRIHQNLCETDPETRRMTSYGIDMIRNVCAIYFYQDLRIEAWPWSSKGRLDPSDVANRLFHLNFCQAVDEATSGEILEAAVKELEKYGYRKVDEQGSEC
jgi:hypothetical protein